MVTADGFGLRRFRANVSVWTLGFKDFRIQEKFDSDYSASAKEKASNDKGPRDRRLRVSPVATTILMPHYSLIILSEARLMT